ncbi:uncharacterized protein [Macaca nemestrina]|uniref:uncharacterized protein n=2 Tax=Macaca TaxID=9539 RepID=UPI0039B8CC56
MGAGLSCAILVIVSLMRFDVYSPVAHDGNRPWVQASIGFPLIPGTRGSSRQGKGYTRPGQALLAEGGSRPCQRWKESPGIPFLSFRFVSGLPARVTSATTAGGCGETEGGGSSPKQISRGRGGGGAGAGRSLASRPPGAAAGTLLWRMCGNLRFGARWTGKGLRRAPPWSEGGAFSWSSEKSGRRRLRFDLPSVTPPGPSQMDKTLQRKCLALMSAVTPAKVYCCLFIIAVLTTSVIVLSIVLSEFPEKIQSPFQPLDWP